jgi:hypothetical protein
MNLRIQIGCVYHHFKGGIYRILALAKDCNNPSKTYVIYQNISNGDTWSREYDEFASKVDKSKYPNVNQEYRFELVHESKSEGYNTCYVSHTSGYNNL